MNTTTIKNWNEKTKTNLLSIVNNKTTESAELKRKLRKCWITVWPHGTEPKKIENIIDDLIHIYTLDIDKNSIISDKIETAQLFFPAILTKWNS